MNSPQRLFGAIAMVALVGAGCNRTDKSIDTQHVRQDAMEAAGDAKVAAAKASDQIADGWLATKIQAQFFADEDIRARDISITANDGVVVLKGRVQDDNAHTQAVQTAKNTDGVKQLIDQLVVGPEPQPAQKPSAGGAVATTGAAASEVASKAVAVLDDTRITSTIRSKYFLNERVKGRHIDVETTRGIVTLRGEVASDAERAEALLLARTTEGVQRVEDNLAVNAVLDVPPGTTAAKAEPVVQQIDDATITTKIQAKYFLDRDVKAGAMDVTTKDGVVLLDGTVPTQASKERALTLARETDGVVQVVDRLKVQAPTTRRK
jgi:hyperosmotically inducible periplasmic protein